MSAPERIGGVAELQQMLARSDLAGEAFRNPLLRAAMHGQIELCWLTRPADATPLARLRHVTRPVVVLLSGDDGVPLGPDCWAGLPTLLRWGRAAIIHAAAGEPEHYAAAVAGALLSGRMIVAETGTQHVRAWTKRLSQARIRTLVVRPADGLPHPIAPRREQLQ